MAISSREKSTDLRIIFVGILIAAAIFYLDLLLPLGVAESTLYVALVLIGLRTRSKNFVLWSAIFGTALILIGFYLSPEGGVLWKVLANRALSTFILWLTAILCLWQIQAETKLQEASEKLEKRVEDRTRKLDEANELLRRESGFVELHKDIAVASNETQAIENTLEYCLKCICAHMGWPVGHLYLTSERYSLQLVPAGIWHLEDPARFETFRKITDVTPFNAGEGLPGRVIESGKPAWIIDVTKDSNFPRANLAKNIGVKAGFAFPIPIGDEIVGVMEFFSSEAVEPDGKLLEIMAQVGIQLGRVLERKRAEEEIKRSQNQLRNLYHRLELVREEERTRMSREIHDELAQALTTLKLEISLLDKKLKKNDSTLSSYTQMMLKVIDTTIQAGKKLVMDLRPPLLDDLGLPEAIEWQAQEYEKRTGIKCDIDLDNNNFVLDKDRSTTLFRIFQETLTNVTRHAKADKINISLTESNGDVTLQIRDNGIGISKKQISNLRSLGLLGIRERALVWGGKVDIIGVPDQGTTVTIKLKRETQ
ncbi:MAG: GAF domain-containing protein [Nitrospinae bacterium]|nr:GAF domain-containing protein [Nitrospinota bacterium]